MTTLYEYIYERVAAEKPEQKPQKWEFNVEGNIYIARSLQTGKDPWTKARQFLPPNFELLDQKFFERRGQREESSILKLRIPTWALIVQGNYIERDQQSEALKIGEQLSQFRGISLLLIQGEPGAGKTALRADF